MAYEAKLAFVDLGTSDGFSNPEISIMLKAFYNVLVFVFLFPIR